MNRPTYPWERDGVTGWDNYDAFEQWIAQQFVEADMYDEAAEEWLENMPTFMLLVFDIFADHITKQEA